MRLPGVNAGASTLYKTYLPTPRPRSSVPYRSAGLQTRSVQGVRLAFEVEWAWRSYPCLDLAVPVWPSGHGGERESERTPLIGDALQPHVPAMVADDAIADEEADPQTVEPPPGALSSRKAMEHLVLLVEWDTDPVVGHGYAYLMRIMPEADAHLASIGRILDRVVQEIGHHLLDPLIVGPEHGRMARHLDRDLTPRVRGPLLLGRVGDQLRHIQIGAPQQHAPGL